MRPRERRARIWPGRAGTARIGPARPDPAQSAIHTRAIYSGPVKLASRDWALSLRCVVLGAPGAHRAGPIKPGPVKSDSAFTAVRSVGPGAETEGAG